MKNPLSDAIRLVACLLASIGVVDQRRGEDAAELAWPRILTGLARHLQRATDIAMVGIAVGPSAVAGMAFALTYWSFASGLGSALSNGAISLISTRFGAEEYEGLDLSIKVSIIASVLLAFPFMLGYVIFSTKLIHLLGADPATVPYGSTYLEIIGLALIFRFPNKIVDRTLVGVNDAFTPMVLRAGGAVLNLVLNAVFIFGLGLGVFGAALGTLLATMFVTLTLGIGVVRGHLPALGSLPISIDLGPPFLTISMTTNLFRISTPLVVRQIVGRGGVFFLIAIVAQFGTLIVVAYEISRQVRNLLNAPSWGFSLAASSLVGQALGAEDEVEAEAYGHDILLISLVVYVAGGAVAFIFARPIALLFVQGPQELSSTIPFIRVIAISVIGRGLDSVMTGTLRAGGDTSWPLYGKLLGLYLFAIPLAYLGLLTPLGVIGLYLAVNAEMWVPALVTLYRYRSGKWKAISRGYRPASME